MIQQATLRKYSFYLFYSGLILLAVSLPLSKFTMSVSQFMIAGSWVIGGELPRKFKTFISSKIAMAIVAIFLLHIIGLIYTTDIANAFKDIRIKLPLLILPLILSTSPRLTSDQFEKVLIAVVAGVTISTFISFLIYVGVIKRPVIDIRDISIFISHIRLALLCCVSVFVSLWLLYKHRNDDNKKLYLLIFIPVIGWLIGFLFLIQSITGLFVIVTVLALTFFYLILRIPKTGLRILMGVVVVSLIALTWMRFTEIRETFIIKEDIAFIDKDIKTVSGNAYEHFTDRKEYENGFPVWAYICEPEMNNEWNKRSKIDYWQHDKRNHLIRFTLIRFLTSKGLRKDSVGVAALSENEVMAIENGTANVLYLQLGSMGSRIHQLMWEINNMKTGANPSGHSLAQRFEYWKAAIQIIKSNPIIGVGTGDLPEAFNNQYESMNSPLTKEWRLRAHNQYLSFGAAFGITGLIVFLVVLIYLLIISILRRDFLYITFAITAMLSMLTEDTLETQAGITFFTLFTCLFLFVNPQNAPVGGNRPIQD